jgi:hypothetical protein
LPRNLNGRDGCHGLQTYASNGVPLDKLLKKTPREKEREREEREERERLKYDV